MTCFDHLSSVSLFLFAAVLVAAIIEVVFVFFVNPGVWFEVFTGYAGYTVAIHVAAGCLMMLIGPFQFWSWLRLKHKQIHRVSGYFYICSELICLLLIAASYPGRIADLDRGVAVGGGDP
jgi:hypothetical protein